MKHFKNIKSFQELKEQFKQLAKANHPDCGGDIQIMQEINAEYDQLFPIWKTRSKVVNEETSNSTRQEFYTQNGWKGKNYNINLSTKEIAKIMRTYVKEIYPTYKFSITVKDYSSIYISLMEAPHEVFTDKADNYTLEEGHTQVNHYSIENNKSMTELTKEVLKDVYNTLQSYNYDDSDAMIDYFDRNFYIHLNIGKWDKPFKVVEKIARIKQKDTKNGNTKQLERVC